jgi:isoleucyl-tRNA synthetase
MDRVREVCRAALALRAAESARVRQPLAELVVAGRGAGLLAPFSDLIADEVNVKNVRLTEEIGAYATFRLQVNARLVGPRLGGETKKVIAAARAGEWELGPGGSVTVAGQHLAAGEFELLLRPREGVACEGLSTNDAVAVLDLALTPELIAEGRARDVVRVVQQARKEADLHVADRIRLALTLSDDWRDAVLSHREYVAEQTLASELILGDPGVSEGFHHESILAGESIRVALTRVE